MPEILDAWGLLSRAAATPSVPAAAAPETLRASTTDENARSRLASEGLVIFATSWRFPGLHAAPADRRSRKCGMAITTTRAMA